MYNLPLQHMQDFITIVSPLSNSHEYQVYVC